MKKILTEDKIKEIQQYYQSKPMGLKDIEDKFNISHPLAVRALKSIPKYPKNLVFNPDMKENYFENSAPGAWTVVVLKDNEPARIVETRKIEFLTWESSLVGRNITSSDLIYEDDANKVYQIYDKVPFVKGVEVKFLK